MLTINFKQSVNIADPCAISTLSAKCSSQNISLISISSTACAIVKVLSLGLSTIYLLFLFILENNILKTTWDQKKFKQYILNLLEKVFEILKSLVVKLNLLKFVWKSPRVQFGSSDDVIKVLLPLSVFLSHPLHQQQFVSIRFPPHLHSLCLPFGDVKQRRCHRPSQSCDFTFFTLLWFYAVDFLEQWNTER